MGYTLEYCRQSLQLLGKLVLKLYTGADMQTDTDRLQKTWIPEGTREYEVFKSITGENKFIATFLKEKFHLKPGELILDVGGREGDVVREIQAPQYIHLVDPDPTLHLPFAPEKFWSSRIQDTNLGSFKYKLINFGHVLGYLGTQNAQGEVFNKLVNYLTPGGTLVLFYNTNTGYMADLLDFSKKNLDRGHYDFFDENLLTQLNQKEFSISKHDISFELSYPSYEELARCCWFLFGSMDQDIPAVAAKFLPKLKQDLPQPKFSIDERITLITRKD